MDHGRVGGESGEAVPDLLGGGEEGVSVSVVVITWWLLECGGHFGS